MSVQQILKSWGIILPEEKNDYLYLPEQLLNKYPTKCYFADFFPKTISSSYAYKHTQIENKIYNLICERMYNVILKLWVYDKLYFESELLSRKIFFLKNIKRRKLLKGMSTNYIEKEDDLYILMKLSKKNVIDLVLVFENLRIIIVPSWSCFLMFVEDASSLSLVKEILSSEGLCLRNACVD